MQEQFTHVLYQKGFNEGYIITQHLPELSDKLSQIKSTAPRVEGFIDGRKQFALEQVRALHPDWTRQDRNNAREPCPAKSKDRDIDYNY